VPFSTSFLQLDTGQRYSVLLTTRCAPEKSQYFIQLESRERPTLTRSYAILNYLSSPSSPSLNPVFPSEDQNKPLTLPNTTLDFLDCEPKTFSNNVKADMPRRERHEQNGHHHGAPECSRSHDLGRESLRMDGGVSTGTVSGEFIQRRWRRIPQFRARPYRVKGGP
jgi:hypothetical protein